MIGYIIDLHILNARRALSFFVSLSLLFFLFVCGATHPPLPLQLVRTLCMMIMDRVLTGLHLHLTAALHFFYKREYSARVMDDGAVECEQEDNSIRSSESVVELVNTKNRGRISVSALLSDQRNI